MTKNLVLGYGTNQSIGDLRIFVNSFRASMPRGEADLVVLTNGDTARYAELAHDNVSFAVTRNSYPQRNVLRRKITSALIRLGGHAVGATGGSSRALRGVHHQLMATHHHPHFARWFAYRDYLRAHPAFDTVLLTDVRDVLFQSSPFEPPTDVLKLYDQDEVYDDQSCDSSWYKHAFGPEAIESVKGRPALCIGTIIGPRAAVLDFIDSFIAHFERKPFRGVEQAVFNHMLLSGALTVPHRVMDNAAEAVATLGNTRSLERIDVASGSILDSNGRLVPVVHMYDRHAGTQQIADRYVDAG